jgi:hydroxyacylglutathione hydrolase
MLTTFAVPALTDNYIWLIKSESGPETIIVDPGEATPVIKAITEQQLTPIAIINTHQHYDHINGIKELVNTYGIPVYGSSNELVPCLTHDLKNKNSVFIDTAFPEFEVMQIPGHTAGHIAYRYQDNLFSGDTIFSGGCGRLLGGTAIQLHNSIQCICQLPKQTRIFASHEYTEQNLLFAKLVEPNNQAILAYQQDVFAARQKGLPSLPTTIEQELAINPFMRCDQPEVIQTVSEFSQQKLTTAAEVFSALRIWKDRA